MILTLCFFTISVKSEITSKPLKNTVFFEREKIVSVSSSKFQIMLYFDNKIINDEHVILDNMFAKLKIALEKRIKLVDTLPENFQSIYEYLIANYKAYNEALSQIYSNIPQTRVTRSSDSWFPVFGRILHTLTGVVDDKTEEQINEKINSITGKFGSIMTKSTMFYKGLEQKFLNTTQFLKSVTTQIVDQLQTTIANHHRDSEITNHKLMTLENDLHVLQGMSHLGFVLNTQKIEFNVFRTAIDFSKRQQLSPTLVNVELFESLLHDISIFLPPEYSLITPPTRENLYMFYETSNIQAFHHNKKILFLISIPLISANNLYTKYHIHSIPTFNSKVGYFFHVDTPDYIYISQDATNYFLDSPNVHCTPHARITLCDVHTSIYSISVFICPIDLFYKHSTNSCDMVVSKNNIPYTIRLY